MPPANHQQGADALELFHPSSDAELADCFPASLALRPHLRLATFTKQVRRQQAQGYRIIAVRVNGPAPRITRAREHGCSAVHLDPGYQRHAAHRLYLHKGFVLSSRHLTLPL